MAKQRGITLIEVLVTIGVIALLLAILLPAVQSARESARRTQCQNNLRQILLATQSFESAEGTLPSLYNGTSLSYPLREWDLFHMHSWRVMLLPYVEQTALKEKLKWDELATADANLPVGQTPVSVFLCPSGGNPMEMGSGLKYDAITVPRDQQTEQHRYGVVRSDYDAMAGIQVLPKPLPANSRPDSVDFVRWGIWGWAVFDKKTTAGAKLMRYRNGKFSDITDGLSNTLAVVERGGKPIDLLDGKPQISPDNPNAEYPGQVGWSASNSFSWAINGDGVGVNDSNARGIYSFHPGGANVGIADGSVRFLSESMDFDSLVALFGRSDGGHVHE
jgi:prepilin-type N-terminal cleavage/methylation domain-containing protein/prepilin-type processing-associated H-X9-DG protein